MSSNIKNKIIVVRGAGDLASSVIWYLNYAGYRVICLDTEYPSCIRREVAFCEAVVTGEKVIQGITCQVAKNVEDAFNITLENKIALLLDKDAESIKTIKPEIVIDSIIAKRNVGTTIDMANVVIGIGPGFTVGVDCHYAIETMRGHNLAYIYDKEGLTPEANTGEPGFIKGFGKERVLHSPCEGVFYNKKKISDIVKKDEVLSTIVECKNGVPTGKMYDLKATLDGVLRGILREEYYANEGEKCADIDPRLTEQKNCFTLSDKGRNIAGAVLLIVNRHMNKLYL